MSSEIVLYIMTAAVNPISAVTMLYDCAAPIGGKCVLLTAAFKDGTKIQGIGCTIFGALHDLIVESKKYPNYFGQWSKLN